MAEPNEKGEIGTPPLPKISTSKGRSTDKGNFPSNQPPSKKKQSWTSYFFGSKNDNHDPEDPRSPLNDTSSYRRSQDQYPYAQTTQETGVMASVFDWLQSFAYGGVYSRTEDAASRASQINNGIFVSEVQQNSINQDTINRITQEINSVNIRRAKGEITEEESEKQFSALSELLEEMKKDLEESCSKTPEKIQKMIKEGGARQAQIDTFRRRLFIGRAIQVLGIANGLIVLGLAASKAVDEDSTTTSVFDNLLIAIASITSGTTFVYGQKKISDAFKEKESTTSPPTGTGSTSASPTPTTPGGSPSTALDSTSTTPLALTPNGLLERLVKGDYTYKDSDLSTLINTLNRYENTNITPVTAPLAETPKPEEGEEKEMGTFKRFLVGDEKLNPPASSAIKDSMEKGVRSYIILNSKEPDDNPHSSSSGEWNGKDHWTLLEILPSREELGEVRLPIVNHYDSVGAPISKEVEDIIIQSIKESLELGDDVKIPPVNNVINEHNRSQGEGSGPICGALVFDNLVRLLDGKEIRSAPPSKDEEKKLCYSHAYRIEANELSISR